jgi:hypothetical protein
MTAESVKERTQTATEMTALLAGQLRHERTATADFLVTLADFDRRGLWRDLGYPSLFDFLHRELALSRGAVHYRKVAAELAQRHPEVVEPLRDGRLCVTSLAELARVVTPRNLAEVLPRFFFRSRREAREVAAEIGPMQGAPPRTVVTTAHVARPHPLSEASAVQPVELLDWEQGHGERAAAPSRGASTTVSPGLAVHRAPQPPAAGAGTPLAGSPASLSPGAPALTTSIGSAGPGGSDDRGGSGGVGPRASSRAAPKRSEFVPPSTDMRRLHVTVSRRFLEKLEGARQALSHSRPGADVEAVLEAGLDLLLAAQARRRGLVQRPRPAPAAAPGSERIPAHVRRAVWTRDAGRCQWPLHGGGICGSTHRLELDHVVPRARGGPSTAANLRVLCSIHNDLAARMAFGDALMDRFTGRGAAAATRRARCEPPGSTDGTGLPVPPRRPGPSPPP